MPGWIGPWEIAILLIVALLVFGPKRLPEMGKSIGKDASAAKPTYPSLFGVARSRELAEECIARAHRILVDGRIQDGWLAAIADWVVARRN